MWYAPVRTQENGNNTLPPLFKWLPCANSSFYVMSWGLDRWSELPKVSQVISGRAMPGTSDLWLQCLSYCGLSSQLCLLQFAKIPAQFSDSNTCVHLLAFSQAASRRLLWSVPIAAAGLPQAGCLLLPSSPWDLQDPVEGGELTGIGTTSLALVLWLLVLPLCGS